MEVTGGFFLLMAWLNYTDTQSLLPMALCAAALHELGHLAAVYALGGGVSRLRLTAAGAELRLAGMPGYGAELLCAAAGPAVNLLLALVFARLGTQKTVLFAGINLALGAFNLLPVSPLDGGRCILAAAGMLTDPDRVSVLRRGMDGAAMALMAAAGVVAFAYTGNLTALIVTGWLVCAVGKGTCQAGEKRVQ